jgi:hypothetical protein
VTNQPAIIQPYGGPIERVPIEQALSVGWDGMKRRFLGILAVLAISAFFAGVPAMAWFFGYEMIQRHLLLVILLSIYQLVVSAVVWLGIIKMALHVNRQQPFTADDFLAVGAQLPSFIGVCILRAILLGIGYMCFIIPGIILQVKLDQADYFIVDRKMGPIAALEASWRVTNGAVLMLWLFGLITVFVQFIGWCAFLIGALPAHMIILLAKAHIYDNLVATTQDATLLGKLAFSTNADTPILVAQPQEGVLTTTSATNPNGPSDPPAAEDQSVIPSATLPSDLAVLDPSTKNPSPLSDVPFLEQPTTGTSPLSEVPFLEQSGTETSPLSGIPFLNQPATESESTSGPTSVDKSATESMPSSGEKSVEESATESMPSSGENAVDKPATESVPSPGEKAVDKSATESVPPSDAPSVEKPAAETTPPSTVSFFDPPSSDVQPPPVPPNIASES